MSSRPVQPTYDSALIKRLVAEGAWDMTYEATDGMYATGCTSDDVWNIIQNLDLQNFHKSMSAEKLPGTMQDVYYVDYMKKHIYLKLQLISMRHSGAPIARVISFKWDDRYPLNKASNNP